MLIINPWCCNVHLRIIKHLETDYVSTVPGVNTCNRASVIYCTKTWTESCTRNLVQEMIVRLQIPLTTITRPVQQLRLCWHPSFQFLSCQLYQRIALGYSNHTVLQNTFFECFLELYLFVCAVIHVLYVNKALYVV